MTVPRNARSVMATRQPSDDDIDFFPTQPWGGRAGAEIIRAMDPGARTAADPACGAFHLVHGLADYFERVEGSDLCLYDGNRVHDFLGAAPFPFGVDWIISNPPFAHGEAFVRRAWPLARRGVAMLMRAACMEGQGRHALLYGDCPLTVFAPFSERLPLVRGRYDPAASSAAFYAWFIFLKPALNPRRFMVQWPDGQWRPGVRDIAPGTAARLTRPSDAAYAVGANGVRDMAVPHV